MGAAVQRYNLKVYLLLALLTLDVILNALADFACTTCSDGERPLERYLQGLAVYV